MTDLLLTIAALLLGLFIGPQIVVTLLYCFPRGALLASRGTMPWSFPLSFLVAPVFWLAALFFLALVSQSFATKVAGFALAIGVASLIWSRASMRADFEDNLRRATAKLASRK